MGKNHRHKKQLKSEKSKVKLKTKQEKTKFLPKGQNVTQVNFKIKPIVLPQQLQEKKDCVLSRRKLNVQDLLKRLKHYSDKMKYAACHELLEMLGDHINEESVQENLGNLIHRLSVLMYEKDEKVRRTSIKVIDIILEKTPAEDIESFFHYLSISLRIAMTDISIYIREDSLLLLDSILKHAPSLLEKNALKIISDFFCLISKLKNDSDLNRTLTVNLGSKLTSVKWRIKVLSRLYAVLRAVFNKKESDKKKVLKLNEVRPLSLLNKQLLNEDIDEGFERITHFDRYVKTLVPLLLDIWVEAAPETSKKTSEKIPLNGESAAILRCVLNIFYLWWKYTEMVKEEGTFLLKEEHDYPVDILVSEEGNKFIKSMMKHFPYSQGLKRKRKGSASSEILKILGEHYDLKCVQENLLISYLFITSQLKNKMNVRNEMESISNYLKSCLSERHYLSQYHFEYVKLNLELIFNKYPKEVKRKGLDVGSILESTVEYYFKGKMTKEQKLVVFDILNKISYEPELECLLTGCEKYSIWLSRLPNELAEPDVTHEVIRALIGLSCRRIESFQNSLIESLPQVLENLKAITKDDFNFEGKSKFSLILDLLSHISFPEESINIFIAFLKTIESVELTERLQKFISQRFLNRNQKHIHTST